MSVWVAPLVLLVGFGVGLLWWFLLVCLTLRDWTGKHEMIVKGVPRSEVRSRIQYHNGRIYRDFEFFVKITLAIAAGVAYLLCRDCPGLQHGSAAGRVLLLALGGLQMFTGLLLSHFVFFHQRSKILRWPSEPSCREAWAWQETWIFASLLGASAAFAVGLTPYLARFL